MRDNRGRHAGMALLALGCMAVAAGPASAEAVVVAATAPGFKAGQALGDSPIEVPDGASLVFILETGQLVTVKGPYAGPPPAPSSGGSRLAKLAKLGGTDQSQLGGTRSVAPVADLARDVPLDLYLATDRGRYPDYRAGEPMQVVLQTNHDAFAYCWISTGRGRVVPLYPARQAEAEPLPGGETLHLPAPDAPALAAEAALDEAQLRCLAAPTPLEADLVQSFIDAGGKALPPAMAERLDAAMLTLGRTGRSPGVVLAGLVLKVAAP